MTARAPSSAGDSSAAAPSRLSLGRSRAPIQRVAPNARRSGTPAIGGRLAAGPRSPLGELCQIPLDKSRSPPRSIRPRRVEGVSIFEDHREPSKTIAVAKAAGTPLAATNSNASGANLQSQGQDRDALRTAGLTLMTCVQSCILLGSLCTTRTKQGVSLQRIVTRVLA
jgi:hypothetical protein